MRIAVYAGTFDPITSGHLSVVERAQVLFDRVVVVVAVNPSKEPLFAPAERVACIEEATSAMGNVAVESTEGLVVELARRLQARFLVRGVRGVTDIEAEIALAHANAELAPEIATVFVPAEPRLAQVSSSRLKELARAGHDVSAYCTPEVALRLRARFGEGGRRSAGEAEWRSR